MRQFYILTILSIVSIVNANAHGFISRILEHHSTPKAADTKLAAFGKIWNVKNSHGELWKPGPSIFTDRYDSVWVDNLGIHLTVKPMEEDNKWISTEVWNSKPLGYGTYAMQISGDVDMLDPNVGFSMFLYDDNCTGHCYHNQISVDMGRMRVFDPNMIRFSVEPRTNKGHSYDFDFPLEFPISPMDYLTVLIEVSPVTQQSFVRFSIYEGHHLLRNIHHARDMLLDTWSFDHGPMPSVSNCQLHFSLFQRNGRSPAYGSPVEITINNFEHSPNTMSLNLGNFKKSDYALLKNSVDDFMRKIHSLGERSLTNQADSSTSSSSKYPEAIDSRGIYSHQKASTSSEKESGSQAAPNPWDPPIAERRDDELPPGLDVLIRKKKIERFINAFENVWRPHFLKRRLSKAEGSDMSGDNNGGSAAESVSPVPVPNPPPLSVVKPDKALSEKWYKIRSTARSCGKNLDEIPMDVSGKSFFDSKGGISPDGTRRLSVILTTHAAEVGLSAETSKSPPSSSEGEKEDEKKQDHALGKDDHEKVPHGDDGKKGMMDLLGRFHSKFAELKEKLKGHEGSNETKQNESSCGDNCTEGNCSKGLLGHPDEMDFMLNRSNNTNVTADTNTSLEGPEANASGTSDGAPPVGSSLEASQSSPDDKAESGFRSLLAFGKRILRAPAAPTRQRRRLQSSFVDPVPVDYSVMQPISSPPPAGGMPVSRSIAHAGGVSGGATTSSEGLSQETSAGVPQSNETRQGAPGASQSNGTRQGAPGASQGNQTRTGGTIARQSNQTGANATASPLPGFEDEELHPDLDVVAPAPTNGDSSSAGGAGNKGVLVGITVAAAATVLVVVGVVGTLTVRRRRRNRDSLPPNENELYSFAGNNRFSGGPGSGGAPGPKRSRYEEYKKSKVYDNIVHSFGQNRDSSTIHIHDGIPSEAHKAKEQSYNRQKELLMAGRKQKPLNRPTDVNNGLRVGGSISDIVSSDQSWQQSQDENANLRISDGDGPVTPPRQRSMNNVGNVGRSTTAGPGMTVNPMHMSRSHAKDKGSAALHGGGSGAVSPTTLANRRTAAAYGLEDRALLRHRSSFPLGPQPTTYSSESGNSGHSTGLDQNRRPRRRSGSFSGIDAHLFASDTDAATVPISDHRGVGREGEIFENDISNATANDNYFMNAPDEGPRVVPDTESYANMSPAQRDPDNSKFSI